MTNNPRSQNNANKPTSFTSEELSSFLELQKLKVANEAKELVLREKDMEHQSKYAHKLLEFQSQIEINKPNENRKTITRMAYILGFLLIIMMVFGGFCLYYNKEDFLYSLIKAAGYFFTTLIGYYAGKKSKSNTANNNTLDSNVQDLDD